MPRLPIVLLISSLLTAQTLRMTTSQYNNMRTGANLSETILTPQNVNAQQFGKRFTIPLDGNVYAQPLYLSHIDVPGKGIRNLLFVETEHDSVYAFDADSTSTEPIWHVSLLPTRGGVSSPVSASDVQCPFISPEIGITPTPVIDTATGTLFVLARSSTRANLLSSRSYSQHLHALAITTGQEKFGGPVEIHASVRGTGEGSSGGEISFSALRENPRAALLLVNGVVYLTWASSCDVGPYHGWVMAYDARTLRQLAVFNTSPGAGESGIWQSDTGPAADDHGDIYVSTGNGLFDVSAGGSDYGDSVLKLHLQRNQLIVSDFFTPANQAELNSTDGDLGSGGPVLIPDKTGHPLGMLFGGKQGVLYDVNPNHMGGLRHELPKSGIESFEVSDGIYSTPAFWNGHVYTYANGDFLKEFAVTNGWVARAYSSRSKESSAFSGGTPTVSANGDRNGVVWIIETRAWNAGGNQAVLRAYDATNVTRLLYSSGEKPIRDEGNQAVRFTIPTVANGRVYAGGVRSVTVYGLFSR